jgi:hypothetical protein
MMHFHARPRPRNPTRSLNTPKSTAPSHRDTTMVATELPTRFTKVSASAMSR